MTDTTEQAPEQPTRCPIRLAICIPTRGECDYKFAESLAMLSAHLGATLIADNTMEVAYFIRPGTYIDKSRALLAQEAIRWGATHQLWLDDDMVFPSDIVFRLLARNVDIVGANYTTRKQPVVPVTFKKIPDHAAKFPGERCFTTESSTGLEEVEAIGFGVVLVRTSVFSKVPYPGFLCQYSGPDGTWMGEDVYFCLKAREHGLKVFVDHDLSKQIGHAGRFVYLNDHAEVLAAAEKEASRRIVTPGEDPLTSHGLQLVH